jgi:hypothetical protein
MGIGHITAGVCEVLSPWGRHSLKRKTMKNNAIREVFTMGVIVILMNGLHSLLPHKKEIREE